HGEAVVWPPGTLHGAYTDGTEMRAIIVELVGDEDGLAAAQAIIDAAKAAATDGSATTGPEPTPAVGALADRRVTKTEYDASEGEPW
ncbi:MAG: hypothetical protein ACR2H0_03535, partial [Candidatus Limnocylindrales bacterium]